MAESVDLNQGLCNYEAAPLFKINDMKLSNTELIADLEKRTNENKALAQALLSASLEDLNRKRTPESWSALECVEHLNRYGYFYLPEIKNKLKTAKKVSEKMVFKSGVLGNYFAKSLLPKEKLNKMKTFANMNPNGSQLGLDAIKTFIQQQEETLEILGQARTVHLHKTKTAVSISKLIKLRLGDTLRVVIYHNQRHLMQAKRALVV